MTALDRVSPECPLSEAEVETHALDACKSVMHPERMKIMRALVHRIANAAALAQKERDAKAVCVYCREGAPFMKGRPDIHGVPHKGRLACEHGCGAAAIRKG